MKDNLYNYSLEKLTKLMVDKNQSSFRSKQLFTWMYKKRVASFNEMSDISKDFRSQLEEEFSMSLPKVEVMQKSNDGTIKVLFKLDDGEKVESVLMHYNYGYSVCVSSQVGCNMSCIFCASGLLKKKRNLEVSEMIGQVMYFDNLLKQQGEHVTHCVIMGTGEPFDNFENVIDFIKILNSTYAFEIGARHITCSTSGVAPKIIEFGKLNLQVNLAISLHAPNDNKRDFIMPINKAYPLSSLIPAIIEYGNSTNGRRVTFEYIMIKGFNDSIDDAKELYKLIKPTFGFVNLIPYNKVVENDLERSDNATIHSFHKYLLSKGVKSTIRKEFGSDIDAACGQLRAKHEK